MFPTRRLSSENVFVSSASINFACPPLIRECLVRQSWSGGWKFRSFKRKKGIRVHSSFRRYSQGNPSQVIFKEIAPSSPADATTRVVKMVSWRMKTVNYLREQTLRHNIFYFKAVLKFS